MTTEQMLAVREQVRKALETIADKPITDQGCGGGMFDLWVWIAGKEWLISGKRTGNERALS